MKTQEIYYAHSRCIYDTIREMNEYAFLHDYYSPQKVINPAHLNIKGIKKFLAIVSQCNTLVASEYEGHIGRGVFCEIARALSEDIKVLVLRRPGKEYTLEPVTGIQVLNQHDWKVKYGKILTF
jgi:hypothetical protein